MNINLVLATGLAYSILGALVMFFSHRALYHKATRIVAGYPRELAALLIQRHDGRCGLIILASGSVLQLIAACGYSISADYWRYPTATILGVLSLYCIWRLLARRQMPEVRADAARGAQAVKRVYETRRSVRLLDAAIQEAANRQARELAKGPRDRSVVYVAQEWECRWWSDKLGVSQDVLRSTVRRVGPMIADVERYLGVRGQFQYARGCVGPFLQRALSAAPGLFENQLSGRRTARFPFALGHLQPPARGAARTLEDGAM